MSEYDNTPFWVKVCVLLIAVICIFLLGVGCGDAAQIKLDHEAATKAGVAEYICDPTTGETTFRYKTLTLEKKP